MTLTHGTSNTRSHPAGTIGTSTASIALNNRTYRRKIRPIVSTASVTCFKVGISSAGEFPAIGVGDKPIDIIQDWGADRDELVEVPTDDGRVDMRPDIASKLAVPPVLGPGDEKLIAAPEPEVPFARQPDRILGILTKESAQADHIFAVVDRASDRAGLASSCRRFGREGPPVRPVKRGVGVCDLRKPLPDALVEMHGEYLVLNRADEPPIHFSTLKSRDIKA